MSAVLIAMSWPDDSSRAGITEPNAPLFFHGTGEKIVKRPDGDLVVLKGQFDIAKEECECGAAAMSTPCETAGAETPSSTS